ncbi:4Fe-4S dicluster domain-containing protein [Bordetella sp. BOR01]|uniref:4Fe-4S dicluster domain-containing protein n=1 Tax=Bordetella sp. BOR01 TaxID=2854779 RepID=UPI001C47EB46|nr:4Fe-4S dicluster domain-containing protein [Bordetella sp. BOR01]MBV7483586.1 4Fe-4S dicluster domain-containing protein [Bordetella sp. BOR01]
MGFTRRQLLTGLKAHPPRVGPDAANDLPWRAQAGTACLTHRGIECRVCGETCSTQAIHFRPQPGGPARPQIDAARCTGCGHCLPACPVAALVPEAA